ncbi:MAG: DUF58 domain-containing protein [Propioniciclava sp.]
MTWPRPTARAAGFAALGAVVLLGAWASGQQDLLWVGVFCWVAPVLTLGVSLLTGPTLQARRTVSPEVAHRGDDVTVTLTLAASDATAPPTTVEDDPGPALGPPHAFRLDPVRHEQARARYLLRPRRRGRFALDRCRYSTEDPLGFWRRARDLPLHTPLLIAPQVHALPSVNLPVHGDLGETPLPRTAQIGPDDATVRSYAAGDDVRRIHWRATAHVGDLMVRREEAAWDPAAWILLDSRAGSHAAASGEYPGFEWLVSAAASIGLRLLADGYSVGLIDAEGRVDTVDQHDQGGTARWLEPLIDVEVVGVEDLHDAVSPLTAGARDGVVIALRAGLDDTATDPLLSLGSSALARVALVLDSPATASSDGGVLTDHGWVVRATGPGGDLAADWSRLGTWGGAS